MDGIPFTAAIQVTKKLTLSPGMEMIIPGRLASPVNSIIGVVEEHIKSPLLVAASVVTTNNGYAAVRVLNSTTRPFILPAGTIIAKFTSLVEDQICSGSARHRGRVNTLTPSAIGQTNKVPDHLASLFGSATAKCSEEDALRITNLLRKYSDVFSTGDDDVGRTNLV